MTPLIAAISPSLAAWLTPIWILGMGCLAGMLALVLLGLVLWALSRVRPLQRLLEPTPVAIGGAVLVAIVAGILSAQWTPVEVAIDSGGEGADASDRAMQVVLTALAAGLAAFGLLRLLARNVADDLSEMVIEGPLFYVMTLVVALSGFGIAGFVTAENPQEIIASLGQLPQTMRTDVFQSEVDDIAADETGLTPSQAIEVSYHPLEVRSVDIETNGRVRVAGEPLTLLTEDSGQEVSADEPFRWRRGTHALSAGLDERIDKLFVQNLSGAPATVRFTVTPAPRHPEVWMVPYTALAIVGLFVLYALQRTVLPKLSAIALATFKSEIAQPLFLICAVGGICAMVLFIWLPYNTFGEDIKMLKDTGLTLSLVLCVIVAIWAASTSVAEEIEGRTALTVLSKPIRRADFVVGKFVGICWTTALLMMVLGIVFLVAVSYKPVYDARESAQADPQWQLCFFEMSSTIPGLLLAYMETALLAAVSVAISTRLPLLANFVISFSIYVLGHLTTLILQSAMDDFPIIHFFGGLITMLLPILDHFNIQGAVAAGATVPYHYLGWTLIYCLIYTCIAMLLALVMFEDRDLT